MKYSLFGNFVAISGKRDDLLNILLKASDLLQKNEDCVHYLVSTSSNDPDAVYVYETWTTQEAHEKSLVPEDIRSLIQEAMPLIKGVGKDSVELSAVGGKGM